MELRNRLAVIHKHQVFPGLTGLYLHVLLRDIGRSLVTVFIPLYIYQQTGSLVWPFLMYAYYNLLVVISGWWEPLIIRKIGLDWSAVVAAILRFLTLLFFILAKDNFYYLWLGFTAWGIMIHFGWIPHHFTILKADDGDHKFGYKSSVVMVFQRLAEAITPLAGGLIIAISGFDWLYKVAMVFVLLSALPLFFDRIDKKEMNWSVAQVKNDLFGKKYRRLNLGWIGEGLEGLVPFWALFIYFYLGQVYKVGLVTGISLLIAVIGLLILGKYTDRKGRGWAKNAFLLLIVIWLVKPFFSTLAGFTTIDSLYYILYSLITLAFNSYVYEYAVNKRRMEFLVRREMLIHGGGAVGCLIMAVGMYYNFWLIGFFMAAVGVWLMKRAVYYKKD